MNLEDKFSQVLSINYWYFDLYRVDNAIKKFELGRMVSLMHSSDVEVTLTNPESYGLSSTAGQARERHLISLVKIFPEIPIPPPFKGNSRALYMLSL